MIGKLLSIQVGRVQHLTAPAAAQIDGRHPFWTSAIFKSPIKGAIQVSPTALADDQQAAPRGPQHPQYLQQSSC